LTQFLMHDKNVNIHFGKLNIWAMKG